MAQTAASAKVAPMHEHREWPRYTAKRTFALSASVNGRVYPCTVADVSLGGARLIFDEACPEPTASEAGIELSHPEADAVVCEPVWQTEQEVGIQFDFSEESLGMISVCIRNMIDLDQAAEI